MRITFALASLLLRVVCAKDTTTPIIDPTAPANHNYTTTTGPTQINDPCTAFLPPSLCGLPEPTSKPHPVSHTHTTATGPTQINDPCTAFLPPSLCGLPDPTSEPLPFPPTNTSSVVTFSTVFYDPSSAFLLRLPSPTVIYDPSSTIPLPSSSKTP